MRKATDDGLQARGCPLIGLPATPDLASHVRRFTDNGWERADAKDMYDVYNAYIDPQDRRRHVAVPSPGIRAGQVPKM